MNAAADRLRVWREALLLPGETDLLASGVRELSEFYGISREEALERARNGVRASRDAWNAAPRRTGEEIVAFYDQCEDYVFEHVHWHSTLTEGETLANVAILEYARAAGVRRYLDLGGGVGANLILFARAGMEVADADVSGPMMAFAKWRLERRGLKGEFLDLKRDSLPLSRFDLLTAVDVLEHVTDPVKTLGAALSSLVPGGRALVAMGFGQDPERPMHLVHTPRTFLSGVRGLGLERESPSHLADFPFLRAYRRVERGRVANLLVRAGDTLAEGARGMGRFAATVVRKTTGAAP